MQSALSSHSSQGPSMTALPQVPQSGSSQSVKPSQSSSTPPWQLPSASDSSIVPSSHVPLEQVSPAEHPTPSLQVDPSGSSSVHANPWPCSLQDSLQSASSPLGPGQGSPVPTQAPAEHVSVTVQLRSSSHADPLGSFPVHENVLANSTQASEQSSSPSGGGQGSPLPRQVPPEHSSFNVQNKPSLHDEPSGSFPSHRPVAGLHDSVQSLSPSAPAQGSPLPPQTPARQVSVSVHKSPSSQGELSGSSAKQLLLASSQDS